LHAGASFKSLEPMRFFSLADLLRSSLATLTDIHAGLGQAQSEPALMQLKPLVPTQLSSLTHDRFCQTQAQDPRRRNRVPPTPQLPWVEGGRADDFIPRLPDTWGQIISQPKLVTRPLIDLAPTSTKSPFTMAQARQEDAVPKTRLVYNLETICAWCVIDGFQFPLPPWHLLAAGNALGQQEEDFSFWQYLRIDCVENLWTAFREGELCDLLCPFDCGWLFPRSRISASTPISKSLTSVQSEPA